MKITLISMVGILALNSAPVFADGASFKADVFTSQSQLNIKGIDGAVSRDFDKDTQDGEDLNAVGGGAALELHLEDQLRIGSGIGYINYEGEDNKGGYSDLVWNAYAALDFVQTDMASLYGLGGLSYHHLTLEDFSYAGVDVEADSTGLLNYDLGVGARFKLNYSTTFGLEYKYTQTFSRNDVDLELKKGALAYNGVKYKDVGIENNELQASLAFQF